MRLALFLCTIFASSNALADARDDRVYANLRRLALSAELCMVKQDRAKALSELARERKYSRLGGVVRIKTVADLQDAVRAADDRETKAKEQLHLEKFTAVPCSDKTVITFYQCLIAAEQSNDYDPDSDCGKLGLFVDTALEYLRSVRSDE